MVTGVILPYPWEKKTYFSRVLNLIFNFPKQQIMRSWRKSRREYVHLFGGGGEWGPLKGKLQDTRIGCKGVYGEGGGDGLGCLLAQENQLKL